MTHYFITYACKYHPARGPDGRTRLSECITTTHPIQWLLDCRAKYGKKNWLERGAPTTGPDASWEEYWLLTWHELPADVAAEFDGRVG